MLCVHTHVRVRRVRNVRTCTHPRICGERATANASTTATAAHVRSLSLSLQVTKRGVSGSSAPWNLRDDIPSPPLHSLPRALPFHPLQSACSNLIRGEFPRARRSECAPLNTNVQSGGRLSTLLSRKRERERENVCMCSSSSADENAITRHSHEIKRPVRRICEGRERRMEFLFFCEMITHTHI